MRLISEPNMPNSDDFYASLLAAHKGLSAAESHAMNARLVLVLANHIGAPEILAAALALARGDR